MASKSCGRAKVARFFVATRYESQEDSLEAPPNMELSQVRNYRENDQNSFNYEDHLVAHYHKLRILKFRFFCFIIAN